MSRLEKMWKSFEAACAPEIWNDEQRDKCKRVFYAGAAAYEMIIAELGELDDTAIDFEAALLHDELTKFLLAPLYKSWKEAGGHGN